MDMLDTKQKIILGIVGGVIILVIGIYFYSQYQWAEEEVFTEELQVENTVEEGEAEQIEENEIIIHISGAVVNEGIVKMKQGARIADQTTPNMIQRLRTIFQRNPLISMGI